MATKIIDIDIDDLFIRCLIILKGEIEILQEKSKNGLLGKKDSKSLLEYIKVLSEMEKKHEAVLNKMNIDEIKKLVDPIRDGK